MDIFNVTFISVDTDNYHNSLIIQLNKKYILTSNINILFSSATLDQNKF